MKYTIPILAAALIVLSLASCGIIPDIIPGFVPDKTRKQWAKKYVYTTEPLKLYHSDDWPGYSRHSSGGELGGVPYDVIKTGSRIYVHGVYRKLGTGIPGGTVYAICTYNSVKFPHTFGGGLGEHKMPWRLAEKEGE